ncbi:MAG: hypothetical protein O3A14_00735 [Cyanobacteria bacterium]|nr:hypothetical protein [Cyanobacteriota bacterium]
MVSDLNPQSDWKSIELQKKELERDMAALMVEHSVCAEEARTTADPVTKAKLEARKSTLLGQYRSKELQLKALERQGQDLNRQILDFDEALPKIDFRKAREVIAQVIETLKLGDGGAAFMLLHQSEAMAGDLLLRAMDDVLTRGVNPPICYRLTFSPAVGGTDAQTFLKLLGRYLGVELSGDLTTDRATICQTLCSSLRDSTVIIRLTNWDAVGPAHQQTLMRWLQEEFWHPLMDQLSAVLEKWCARIIFVVVANRKLTDDCRAAVCFCTVDEFDSGSVLELPLEHWTERDIRLWLQEHFQLSKPQRNHWSEFIYGETRGDPSLTRKALQGYFDDLLASQME